MRDIVATIQAEQDENIRLDHPEVLLAVPRRPRVLGDVAIRRLAGADLPI
jgi:hypothetical protein